MLKSHEGIFGSEVWFCFPESDQDSEKTQTLSYVYIFLGSFSVSNFPGTKTSHYQKRKKKKK